LKFNIIPMVLKNLKKDEWNELDIIVQGDMAEFKCNGKIERTQKTKAAGSPFGIRAEYGAIELRRIRVKEAP